MATPITSSNSERLHPGWSSLSGKVLEGGFELQELLEADESQARFKVRVLGDRDLDCVALFFGLTAPEAAAQVELWSLTRQLRHPNISAPLGAGQLEVDGLPAATYAVVRRADESLDTVLAQRALTVAEAGEALESAAKALEILHLNGLVHGCLAPSRVLAVGDSIKLPAECVRTTALMPAVRIFTAAYLAPESQSENLTPQTDLWCLGATLFEALTQKVWTENSREETGALPEPFASIALRCLHSEPGGRANLAEVMALYRGELKPVPRVRAAVAGSSTVLIVPEKDLAPAGSGKPESPKPMAPDAAAKAQPQPAQPDQIQPNKKPVDVPNPPAPVAPPASASAAGRNPVLVSVPSQARPVQRPNREPGGARSAAAPPAPRRPSLDEATARNAAPRDAAEAVGSASSTKLWIWAAVTVLAVVGLIWALRPRSAAEKTTVSRAVTPPAATGQKSNTPPPSANGKPSPNSWETRTLQPDGTARATPDASSRASAAATPATRTPAPQAPASKNAKAPPPASAVAEKPVSTPAATGPELWRVIVYTYAREGDAQKKAADINARHGNLQADVFSPSGNGSPFLVTVGGGRSSRDDAAKFRRKAVGSGLPHDSYIQNYRR